MQKFLKITLISVLLILTLGLIPGFADDEGEFEPLSQAFLEWQSKHQTESDIPASKNALPGEESSGGHIPFPVDLSYLAENPPVEDESPRPNRKDSTLPDKFDLRNVSGKSYVTSVKSQLPYGTCWAFAVTGAVESSMLMQGLGNYDLSEMHTAWYSFRCDDKSKAFYNMYSSSFASIMGHGGNSFYPAALFTRLSGPTYESEVPYGENKQPSQGSPDDYTLAARVREIYYLNYSNEPNVNASESARDIIKRRIMETGSVVGNYYSNNPSYYRTSSGGTSYYYNYKSTNHAVQIIGWDDSYSRSNFKTNPGVDGAWLIKNSWGDEWWTGSSYAGDNGCFWMSYAQYLTEGTAFVAEKPDSAMKAYYYDALGWCGSLSYGGSAIYSANVFKAERDGETLTEIGFITPDNNISYDINVYAGLSSMPEDSPIPSGNRAASSSASGRIAYAGYHTVPLDEPVTLSEGEYFSVVVTFKNCAKTAVEKKVSGWSDNAVIEDGSFFSSNGSSWITGKSKGANATVKAFTVSGTVSGTSPRIHDGYPNDAYLNSSYSAQFTASGTKPITWSASGNVPSGLAIDSSTGELSGTPTTEGSFTFSVTAKNSYGSDTKSYTVNVWNVPVINAEDITGYSGYNISYQLTLTPSVSATWSTSDTLPSGLSLSKSGLISGKTTSTGTYTIKVKAVSSAGTSEADVNIIINAKPVKPTIKIASLKAGTVGEEFSHEIEATGTEPITITIEGQPDGISLNGTTAYMSGTPTTAGTYSIKITAENIATQLDNKPVTKIVKLTVKARKPVINVPDSLEDAVMGEDYGYYDFTLSDGSEPVTWKISGQPAGMKMSTSGTLSGKPTRAGKFTLTVRATNSGGYDTAKIPFTVLQKPSISTTRMSNATTDKKYTAKLSAKGSTPIAWEIYGLPDTMTFTQNESGTTATVTGTPVEARNYEVKLRVSNSAGEAESTVKLYVAGVAPKLTASLSRGEVGEDYNETRIHATGTKPIEITYSINASDLAKFGAESLSDLGLLFYNDSENGTAVLTGTPEISVKNLPITFSASNSVTTKPVTKKVNFTIAGKKPVFIMPEENTVNILCAVNSDITLDFETDGTKNITYSMNRVNEFTLEQTGDYSATLTGTAPARDSNTTITVTASNADGKSTKRVIIKAQTPPEITTDSISAATLKKKYSVKFAATGTRTIKWKFEGSLPEGMKFSNGTLSGTPKETGEFTFTLTAYNALDEDTKEFTLAVNDPDTGSLPEVRKDEPTLPETVTESEPETQNEQPETESPESESQSEESKAEPAITFGESRTADSHEAELSGNGYIIAAILPELSVNVSGMYDIEAVLSENAPEGAELVWLAYPDEAGKSEDDEIAEFYDEAGAEILTVPSSRKITVSVWLNEGVKYNPVIAVKQ